jgi:hypothetical protein
MPEDGHPGDFHGLAPTDGLVSGRKSPIVELTEQERVMEHMIGAHLAAEYLRLRPLADARAAAAYAAQVTDNSRALATGSARSHMSLLRGQLRWLRGLPVGSGELQW